MHAEVGAQVQIEDFYQIGSKNVRDVVLVFNSISDKHVVLANKKNIKHLINKEGQGYFFKDFKTTQQNEITKRCMVVRQEVQSKEDTKDYDVYVKKNKIMIGDTCNVQAINAPDPTKLLQLPLQELNSIMASQVDRGAKTSAKFNYFTGYTVATKLHRRDTAGVQLHKVESC